MMKKEILPLRYTQGQDDKGRYMVIGITGPNASGKGEAASYLRTKGFIYYSLSDILREKCAELGLEPVRDNLIKLGNDMRRENGPSCLAAAVREKLTEKENYIIDSIRNPSEITELRKTGDFILIGIDAPVEMRFKRSLKRKRRGDAVTLSEFVEKEEKENKNNAENQQLEKCLNMADVVILNDSSLDELSERIDGAVGKNK
jgi:dephospho-CoA kinase